MTKKREIITEIGVFERLIENPDFQLYLDILRSRRETIGNTLRAQITTQEQMANHNENVGAMRALDRAIALVGEQLQKYHAELDKSQE